MPLLRFLLVLTLSCPPGTLRAEPDVPAVQTERFELRSDPRANLHHFLLAWAAADKDAWPFYALPVAERGYWHITLDDRETKTWSAATEAYAATLDREIIFDEGLLALRDWSAGVATRDAIPAADEPLADALESALPIYARHWWPAHDSNNRAWIEMVQPSLAAVEKHMPARLEAAYGGRWPEAKIPVDVVIYSNPVGAYSTRGRITISSADSGNRMPQAVELIFHEASHVDSLEGPLRNVVEEAFSKAGGAAPERFWHDLIFYTTGAITRSVFAELRQPGYRHYGEFGVYQRGERWAAQLRALEGHWAPFLDSGSNDASQRLAALEAAAEVLTTAPAETGRAPATRQ
jgi:hypothetical protein